MKTLYLSTLLMCLCFIACNDVQEGPIDHDGTAPGMVENVAIEQLPGGATFTYTLPSDPDLLCVEARYQLADGVDKIVRASYHTRSISVEGFADTSEYNVQLICIDRSENRSQPYTVAFHPQTPPVISAAQTLSMQNAFGGIKLNWKNPGKAALTIEVLTKDSLGYDQVIDVAYSSSEEGEYEVGGLDTTTRAYTVRFRDKWNNYSANTTMELSPIYEVILDRSLFRNLGADYADRVSIGDAPRLWDNNFADNAFLNENVTIVPWHCSWDLGVKAKISKIIIWQYGWPFNNYGHYYYGGNGRYFKVYGTNTPEDVDSWILLQECEIVKKSGLPVALGRDNMSDEDYDIAHNQGHKFVIPVELEAVRYFRLESLKGWDGTLGSPSEVQIFGNPNQE